MNDKVIITQNRSVNISYDKKSDNVIIHNDDVFFNLSFDYFEEIYNKVCNLRKDLK